MKSGNSAARQILPDSARDGVGGFSIAGKAGFIQATLAADAQRDPLLERIGSAKSMTTYCRSALKVPRSPRTWMVTSTGYIPIWLANMPLFTQLVCAFFCAYTNQHGD
jgi:hypothetical protein